MIWQYQEKPVKKLPENTHGFIYGLKFTDGTMYIGKKQCISVSTIPALATGIVRKGAMRINKLVLKDENGRIIVSKKNKAAARKRGIKATRTAYDVTVKEAKWKNYESSSDDVKNHTLESKHILEYITDPKMLTYREEYYLFLYKVLEDPMYLNSCIGNRYWKFKEGVVT